MFPTLSAPSPAGTEIRSAGWTQGMQRSVLRQMLAVVSRPGILSFAGGLPAPDLFPTADYSAALRANLAEPGRIEVTYQMAMASKAASEARLAQVTAPVLVLMGSKDPDFKAPETEARWVAEALHGRLQMIDGAGHYPHAEMPEVTGAQIVAFAQAQLAGEAVAHGA